MAIYLQIENLTKSFGDRILFSDINLGVNQGDKIGIIAPNGAGKTTFLRILCGEEDYDFGKITFRNDIRVGYLPQTPAFNPDDNAMQYLLKDVDIVSNPEFEEKGKKFLHQFKIFDLDLKMGSMSGGQIKKIALAKVLIEDADILILDEPTNHLDISIVEWLENYLSHQKKTLLMVTHDRYFLDKVCNKIIEIDRGSVFSYEGNYSYFLEKREERYDVLNAELAKVRNILRKELDWMRRQPQARATKSKSRIDNYYKLQERSKINLNEKEINLGNGGSYIGSKIFEAKEVCKSFGDLKIVDNWSYDFARYDKVGIVGENGTGKTSFVRLLLGELSPDKGHFDIGQTVKWGYYSQQGMTDFDENKKVIDAVKEIAENVRIDEKTVITASQFLMRFLFSASDQQKYIYKLSGGELRRLYLATVLMKNPNFLILDEPTNDLDINTLAILEEYLVNFKGCVIVISHDRFFLDRIANHIFVFKGNGEIKDFPGNYTDYRDYLKEHEAEQKDKKGNHKKDVPIQKNKIRTNDNKNKLTFSEKKEMEELNKKLEELIAEKNKIESEMISGSLDHTTLYEMGKRMEEIIAETDNTELRLLELMEKE